MPRLFTDILSDGATKKSDQDAKKKAADEAEAAFIAAQTSTSAAMVVILNSIVKLGNEVSVPNDDGKTISTYYVDKASPSGFSVKVVPNGATAEVPDDPDPTAVPPPPPPPVDNPPVEVPPQAAPPSASPAFSGTAKL